MQMWIWCVVGAALLLAPASASHDSCWIGDSDCPACPANGVCASLCLCVCVCLCAVCVGEWVCLCFCMSLRLRRLCASFACWQHALVATDIFVRAVLAVCADGDGGGGVWCSE